MIKRLIATYRLLKQIDKYYEEADAEDYWSNDDALALAQHPTYTKLLKRLQNAGVKASVEACQPSDMGDHRRGMAFGLILSVNLIKQHFPANEGIVGHSEDDEAQELDPLFSALQN